MQSDFKKFINGIIVIKLVTCNFNSDFQNFTNLISNGSIFLEKSPFYDYGLNLSTKLRDELILKLYRGDLWFNVAKIVNKNDYVIYQPFETYNNLHSCNAKLYWLKNAYYFERPKIKPIMKLDIKIGENIGIVCPYCKEFQLLGFIFWYRMNPIQNTFSKKYVHLNMNSTNERMRIVENVLYINDFQATDSGIYFCITDESFRTNKALDQNQSLKIKQIDDILHGAVSHKDMPFKIDFLLMDNQLLEQNRLIFLNESLKVENPETYSDMKVDKISDYYDSANKFRIYNMWQEWSICETCNLNGLRSRFGECRVIYEETSDSIEFLKYIARAFFPDGWSCYSIVHFHYMPLNTSKLGIFRDYVQYDYCKKDCDSFEKEKVELENMVNL